MMRIPYQDLRADNAPFTKPLHEDLDLFLAENQYILGPATAAFEEAYAAYCGSRHCVAMSSGFSALFLMMKGLGIGEGDEVIVSAHTCDATWLSVSAAGARPIPCDADPSTQNLDVALLPGLLSPKTRAVLAVHMNGNPAPVQALRAFCRSNGLVFLEDNAQASGALYLGRKTGSLSEAAAHSFYPTKNLGGLMDGGAITTNDEALAARLRLLRNYGRGKNRLAQIQGYNLRPSELNSRFLLHKLAHLDEIVAHRQAIAEVYEVAFRGNPSIGLQTVESSSSHARHLFTVMVQRRDWVQKELEKKGIGTAIHYPMPVHLTPAYSGQYTPQPVAERIAVQTLSLPMGNSMPMEWAKEVAEAMLKLV